MGPRIPKVRVHVNEWMPNIRAFVKNSWMVLPREIKTLAEATLWEDARLTSARQGLISHPKCNPYPRLPYGYTLSGRLRAAARSPKSEKMDLP